jgi:hypothetical protein
LLQRQAVATQIKGASVSGVLLAVELTAFTLIFSVAGTAVRIRWAAELLAGLLLLAPAANSPLQARFAGFLALG